MIWVLSHPVVCAVDSNIRELTKVDIQSMSDQSSVKTERKSRISKDTEDMLKIEAYFTERLLFEPSMATDCLMNICTGLKAPPECNIVCANEVGIRV